MCHVKVDCHVRNSKERERSPLCVCVVFECLLDSWIMGVQQGSMMICELSAAGCLDRSHSNMVAFDVVRRKVCCCLAGNDISSH